jgi:prephenate dehydratase
MKRKVAIQGILGAFHEEAAVNYYKNEPIEFIQCKTFSDLIQAVENNSADTGIMAVENSLAGSILPNFALIENSDLKIHGEIYLRIIQNLTAKHVVRPEEISEVYSHPMAIYQCSQFFKNYPHIKLIESFDTAMSAREIAQSDMRNTAAIASSFAANRYQLNVIAESIENNKLNYTRFFEIKQGSTNKSDATKSSICFSLPNKTGSLSGVLSIFAQYGMNLHKIQSHPIIGKPWKYSFYIDIIFDEYERYKQSTEAVKPLTENFKILGVYKEGHKSLEKIHSNR